MSCLWVLATDPTAEGTTDSSDHGIPSPTKRTSSHEGASFSLTLAILPPRVTGGASNASSEETLLPPGAQPSSPLFKDSGSPAPSPLYTILSNLPANHAKFFDMLDAELDKVKAFYDEKEKEMHEHDKLLREQFKELAVHRKMFYKSRAQSKAQSWTERACLSVTPALSSLVQWFPHLKTKSKKRHQTGGKSVNPHKYQHAKKRLRKAVIEHYRYVETVRFFRKLASERSGRERPRDLKQLQSEAHVLVAF
ncbi:hypothetical protein OG21DRAFT_894536 [Imleria badia]|nr:hypothetical protein OG21DRAFT_894536 [Imleria badia]